MRIAYVCCDPGVPVFGCKGSSIHVQEVLRELLRQGHDIDLFAACLGGSCPADLTQIHVKLLKSQRVKDHALRERDLLSLNAVLKLLLSQCGPYSFIYERYSLFAFAAMEFARAKTIPGILEVNSPLINEQAVYRVLVDRELAEQTTRRAMTAAGAVVAVSKPVGDYVGHHRHDSSGIHVIANGVNPERFNFSNAEHHEINTGPFTIGFVGTLKPWHGVAELLNAFPGFLARVPGSRLLIIGDGPELESLRARARLILGDSIERADFLGAVDAVRIPNLLRQMDVAVAPYTPHDNFYFSPLKIFEYMAAGLPIVASDVGQIADIIEHERTGLLVQAGNSQKLMEALIRLANDPRLCAELGARAKTVVESRFTWRSIVARIVAIASEMSGNTARPSSGSSQSFFEESYSRI